MSVETSARIQAPVPQLAPSVQSPQTRTVTGSAAQTSTLASVQPSPPIPAANPGLIKRGATKFFNCLIFLITCGGLYRKKNTTPAPATAAPTPAQTTHLTPAQYLRLPAPLPERDVAALTQQAVQQSLREEIRMLEVTALPIINPTPAAAQSEPSTASSLFSRLRNLSSFFRPLDLIERRNQELVERRASLQQITAAQQQPLAQLATPVLPLPQDQQLRLPPTLQVPSIRPSSHPSSPERQIEEGQLFEIARQTGRVEPRFSGSYFSISRQTQGLRTSPVSDQFILRMDAELKIRAARELIGFLNERGGELNGLELVKARRLKRHLQLGTERINVDDPIHRQLRECFDALSNSILNVRHRDPIATRLSIFSIEERISRLNEERAEDIPIAQQLLQELAPFYPPIETPTPFTPMQKLAISLHFELKSFLGYNGNSHRTAVSQPAPLPPAAPVQPLTAEQRAQLTAQLTSMQVSIDRLSARAEQNRATQNTFELIETVTGLEEMPSYALIKARALKRSLQIAANALPSDDLPSTRDQQGIIRDAFDRLTTKVLAFRHKDPFELRQRLFNIEARVHNLNEERAEDIQAAQALLQEVGTLCPTGTSVQYTPMQRLAICLRSELKAFLGCDL